MATANVIPHDGLTEYVISGSTKGEVVEGAHRICLSYPGCRITEDPPIMDGGHIRTYITVEGGPQREALNAAGRSSLGQHDT